MDQMLQSARHRDTLSVDDGTLIVQDGWIVCPVCKRGKLLKLLPTTIIRDLPVKCKRCGQISKLNTAVPEPESRETSA